MYIRDAMPDDNEELQKLQGQCPMGTALIVSTVNTPDFFARVKSYESWKVVVACENSRIIGSAACAVRKGVVNRSIRRVGYEFQYFASPEYRRRGIGRQLHEIIEEHLTRQGAALTYCLVMEANVPSMRLCEVQGFKLHRTLVVPCLVVQQVMDVASKGKVRPIVSEDLITVAELLNRTWQGFELYEPTTADGLVQFVERTPAYSFDNLLVLEDRGEILALLGFWDWSRITRITVEAGTFGTLKPGDMLKQIVLTPIGFKDPEFLSPLLSHVNNQALLRGIQQIFCICERDHVLLDSMSGFTRVDIGAHLYVKLLQRDVRMGDQPVFVNGIDL
jgi:GNAT superfamily N-acetyltransferase